MKKINFISLLFLKNPSVGCILLPCFLTEVASFGSGAFQHNHLKVVDRDCHFFFEIDIEVSRIFG